MTKFDAEEALRLIDQFDIAWAMMVPTMMNRIWRLPEEVRGSYDISSLEAIWHSAAPMPAWLKDAWIDWIGPEKVWEIYGGTRSEEHTSELQSLMRISYAVFCLKKKKNTTKNK